MSDSEGDLSDQLLELVGDKEKKRRKRQQTKSAKRRKTDLSESDDDHPESEEHHEERDPYPLDGVYIDEADRQRLNGLSEIEREDILALRAEEKAKVALKSQLDQMVKDQSGKKDESTRGSKRQHQVSGATKEKRNKLDELKAKRKEKDDRKRTRTGSPKRERSSSPMDMETSDDEDEDGQISKLEEQEEKVNKLYGNNKPAAADDEPFTIIELNKAQITRDMIVKFCYAPWFEELLTGAFTRVCVGIEQNASVYRACEVISLKPSKIYKVNDTTVNQEIFLRHGKAEKTWTMDQVSNQCFTEREFNRLITVLKAEGSKVPTKRQMEKKIAQIEKYSNHTMTETDISNMIDRRKQISSSGANLTLRKSRLLQEKHLAMKRAEYDEVARISAELAEINGQMESHEPEEEDADSATKMARINERNRKANLEAIRNAELRESERKRRERKLAASGVATPNADPSARLKTVPKLVLSRPGTPGNATPQKAGTPAPRSDTPSGTPAKPSNLKNTFEASVLASVDVDLGDF